ncbi:MAG TPA: tyrosine-type recombinase/integrase [Anaerolineales bacterium]|nr:tyrosine-type recombinase/integrase [Anaerolineales bacterium]
MKLRLTKDVIKHQLRFDQRPIKTNDYQNRILETVPNTKTYIVWDATPGVPTGFGVRVGKTKITYIVQKRALIETRVAVGFVEKEGIDKETGMAAIVKVPKYETKMVSTVVKISLGEAKPDYHLLEDARKLAMKKILDGVRPEKQDRSKWVSEMSAFHKDTTLGEAWDYCRIRWIQKKLNDSTMRTADGARNRFNRKELKINLLNMPLAEIDDDQAISIFNQLSGLSRQGVKDPDKFTKITTSAEHSFSWANRVAKMVMVQDAKNAVREQRVPYFLVNPFEIVRKEMFRKSVQLEDDQSKARRPMSLNKKSDDPFEKPRYIGTFIDSLLDRTRPEGGVVKGREVSEKRLHISKTSGDYLLLTLLCGTRRSEAACLAWGDRLTEGERKTQSHVDLVNEVVWFHNTKNKRSHMLPLGPAALKLLKDREADRDFLLGPGAGPKDKRWKYVFPVRSTKSEVVPGGHKVNPDKKRVGVPVRGHYADSKAILESLNRDIKFELHTHDLRRTFGRVAGQICGSERMLKKLLNHFDSNDITGRYIDTEVHIMREVMAKIELKMLQTSNRAVELFYPVGRWAEIKLKSS